MNVVKIVVQDGLMFPSGTLYPASYSCVIFCRVPADWLDGAELHPAKLEAVYERLYGPGWRAGNDDGSRYVVRSVQSRVLSPAEEQAAPWRELRNSREFHYWFYRVSNGELQQSASEEL